MALFNKTAPRNGNGDPSPATPQLVRSRFQEILDDVNAIVKYSDHAASLASALVHDLEKGLRYFDRLKIDLTQCLAEAGASETQIEQDIKASIDAKYVPPTYRQPQPEKESE
jgi:hypothetical protein